MKVNLNLVNDAVHFEALGDATSVKVNIDGSPEIGGQGLGVRPMELVLMALGSCSSLDLLNILRKQKQDVKGFSVSVDGERSTNVPAVFTKIQMDIRLSGTIDRDKAERAAELAIRKYCSVHDMLVAGGVKIDYSIDINPAN